MKDLMKVAAMKKQTMKNNVYSKKKKPRKNKKNILSCH